MHNDVMMGFPLLSFCVGTDCITHGDWLGVDEGKGLASFPVIFAGRMDTTHFSEDSKYRIIDNFYHPLHLLHVLGLYVCT